MADRAELDRAWLAAHPLPAHGEDTDKNSRGHVISIGGSRAVPGGLLLTAEAALRAGAGKVQLATVESCVVPLGVALPEAGVIALGENDEGEIDDARLNTLSKSVQRCDAVVFGPAMVSTGSAGRALDAVLGLLDRQTLLLDAVALHCAGEREGALRGYPGALIVTPNPDEIASVLSCGEERVAKDMAGCARELAQRFDATAVCKGNETMVATPDGKLLHYPGGGVGLATGGSGDVLAGLMAGLLARGAHPLTAAGWAVWLHGEAGRRIARDVGPIGFLARELLPLVSRLMSEPG